MKHLAIVAIALALGVAALLTCDSFGLVPADSYTRRNYAAALERDFIAKRVRDTIVSTSGPENRWLLLDASWLDRATAMALINEGLAQRAGKKGFDTLIFQNQGFRLPYDVREQAFKPEPVGTAQK